jgi:succinate dehydrogenase flavin-adding protein (antitoxin of CptAB toxin-antitoxin module)
MIDKGLFERYVDLSLEIDIKRHRPLFNQDLDNRVVNFSKADFIIEKTFGWMPANPSDPERVKELKATFVDPQVVKDGVDSTLSNELVKMLLSNDKAGLIVGKRGSGKTTLVNYVLTARHQQLQESGITWLRADIAKLHAINEEIINKKKGSMSDLWTVNDYLALHSFHVIIQYAKNDEIFIHAFSHEADYLESSGPSPIEVELTKVSPELANLWRIVRNTENQRKKACDAKNLLKENDSDLKWYFLQLYKQISSKQLASLYIEILAIIKTSYSKEKLFQPKIVFLFDGVDNIRIDEHAPSIMKLGDQSARNWYLGYLSQLRQYLSGGGGCLPSEKNIFIFRTDTEKDFYVGEVAHQQTASKGFDTIQIVAPDFGDIFSAKFKMLKQKITTSSVNSEVENPDFEKVKLLEAFYTEFCSKYVSELKKLSSTKQIRKSLTVNDVILIIFNGNIRSFSRNLIRTFLYLDRYCKNNDKYNTSTTEEREDIFKKAFFLIVEGGVLCGNRFMRLNHCEHSKGRWCPNFFEFQMSSSRRWDGLIIFRVLQSTYTSDDDRPSPTLTEIVNNLKELGYSESGIQVAVYTCIEFGLLELKDLISNLAGGYEFTLDKTQKGSFIQGFTFHNPKIFYLIATGSVYAGIPESELSALNSCKFLHRTKHPRFFNVSALWTSAHLMRHIKVAHSRDMRFLAERNSANFTELEKQYTAPQLDMLIKGFSDEEREGMSSNERVELEKLPEIWKQEILFSRVGQVQPAPSVF